MTPRARLLVDLPRLTRNVDTMRDRLGDAELMVVVKNDAYGQGVEPVVATAAQHGVTWFGSFDVDTGIRTRAAAGDAARIFAWVTVDRPTIAAALDARLELGVGDAGYLEDVAAVSAGRQAPVHLKIDTGLHRNGVRPEAWGEFVDRAAELERAGDIRVVGVWSHIAETSDADDDDSRAQFHAAVDRARAAGLAPATRHLSASAASYARPEFRHDLARIGAFVYGIRSTDGPDLPGIVPTATLLARVEDVAGDEAVIGIGSLDGLPSVLGGRVEVGTPAGARPLLRLDPMAAAVRAWPGAQPGDEVALFGPGALGESSVTTLAEAIGTVGEEIIVRVSPLIPREYVPTL
jgi:alanine racemase